jgi:predicted HicB family RNase H-like nuclease
MLVLEYRGYLANVDSDYYGYVINTKDLITFQGTNDSDIGQVFIDSVDDYFDFCKMRGEEPEQPNLIISFYR